jgi:hypothetical protein
VYDFCVEHPADGRLLLSYRPEDLASARIDAKQRAELVRLNDPVAAVVKDLARPSAARHSRRHSGGPRRRLALGQRRSAAGLRG